VHSSPLAGESGFGEECGRSVYTLHGSVALGKDVDGAVVRKPRRERLGQNPRHREEPGLHADDEQPPSLDGLHLRVAQRRTEAHGGSTSQDSADH